ncbi:hypothetical protein [Polaromonas sp. P5_D5]
MSSKSDENGAARIAACRAMHELVTLSVDVPAEVVAGIEGISRLKTTNAVVRPWCQGIARTSSAKKCGLDAGNPRSCPTG